MGIITIHKKVVKITFLKSISLRLSIVICDPMQNNPEIKKYLLTIAIDSAGIGSATLDPIKIAKMNKIINTGT